MTVAAVREHKARLLVRFAGVETTETALRFAGARMFAAKDLFRLGPDEFLDEDLVGCRLFDPSGTDLGKVDAIEHYAQDLLVVGNARVPLVRAFVKHIDIGARRIEVDLPLGLLDEREAEEG